MLKMGVIGYGYWGPNIVRNFNAANGSQVTVVCDMNAQTLKNKVKKAYPGIKTTTEIDEIIKDPEVDAVAIVTPVFTHFEIAKKALEAGKSIFVEKPFTYTVAEAEQLVNLAEKKNLKIMNENLISLMIDIDTVSNELKENIEKFKNGNKAAGQRARKNTLTLTKLYKEFRAESVKI